jgi:lysophospholipase L1-like esterase
LPYINIFNLFTGQGNKFLLDGLHPNTQGHKLIYEKVKPELDKLLNS